MVETLVHAPYFDGDGYGIRLCCDACHYDREMGYRMTPVQVQAALDQHDCEQNIRVVEHYVPDPQGVKASADWVRELAREVVEGALSRERRNNDTELLRAAERAKERAQLRRDEASSDGSRYDDYVVDGDPVWSPI